MIKTLEFENYRCYESSKITYKDLVVIVGQNNAGKTTMIEALRMVAFAVKKAQTVQFSSSPAEFGLGVMTKGVLIDTHMLKIDLRGVVYLYEDRIAKVTVTFENKSKIVIMTNPKIAMAFVYDKEGRLITTKGQAKKVLSTNIAILPQIGLIKENEIRLKYDTVEKTKDTYLSSRHFRNEILLYKDSCWDEFVDMAQKSWDGLEIQDLIYDPFSIENHNIQLMVSDNRFLAEIGLMGSGLQMWLQIIWFLCKNQDCDTLILDEPDVYMHPDLQIKLLYLVKSLNKQVIIATHSVEIISQVEPKNIVMVDKKRRIMKYADSIHAVQGMVDKIGGIQNMDLIRIGLRKKCLFVEGTDHSFLTNLYNAIYKKQDNPIATLPVVSLGGFCNYVETFGTAKLFYGESEGSIKSICILDRDYHWEETLEKMKNQAETNHLYLHIWSKKEIENYLIVPMVLFRFIKSREDSYEKFIVEFESIIDEFEDVVFDGYANQFAIEYPDKKESANKRTRMLMCERWSDLDSKLSMVPGKACLHRIRTWMKEKYNICPTERQIMSKMKLEDVAPEMLEVMDFLR